MARLLSSINQHEENSMRVITLAAIMALAATPVLAGPATNAPEDMQSQAQNAQTDANNAQAQANSAQEQANAAQANANSENAQAQEQSQSDDRLARNAQPEAQSQPDTDQPQAGEQGQYPSAQGENN
jgi:hypothetical protein